MTVSALGGPISETLPEMLQRLTDCVRDAAAHRSGYAQSRDIQALAAVRAVLTQHEEDFAWLQMALGGWEAFRPVRATNEMRDVLARIAAVLAGVRSDG